MDRTLIIGMAASVCTTIAFVPQVVRIIKTRHTKDISLLTYLIFTIGLSLWFAYGVLLRDLPIVLANGATLVLAMGVLALKIRYG